VGWLLAAGCCWRLYGRHRGLVGGDVGSGGAGCERAAPTRPRPALPARWCLRAPPSEN